MRVKVYRNLYKGTWSVVSVKTGRVVMHADTITLRDVTFRVQPAGNRLVRACGRKNVHAYAVGEIASLNFTGVGEHRVTYNPYIMTTFEYADNGVGSAVGSAEFAEFTDYGSAYVSCDLSLKCGGLGRVK